MAKVKGPLHSMQASGTVGSLIYSRNQYGAYTRDYVVPSDPATTEQQEWRDNMGTLVSRWNNDALTTPSERDSWEAFAREHPLPDRLGQSRCLNARDWYIRCNIFRLRAGYNPFGGPPLTPECSYVPALTLSQETDGIYLNTSIAPTTDNILYASVVLNQNTVRHFMPHSTSFAGVWTNTSSTSFLVIDNDDLSEDTKRQFVKVRCIDIQGTPAPPRILYIDAGKTPEPTDINPAFDTYISDQNPTTNYETEVALRVRTFGSEYLDSLLFFDMSSIPAGRTIDSVTLYLYAYSVNNGGNVGCHEILVSSVPTELTWNIKSSGNNWGIPGMQAGVDYTAIAEDTTTITTASQWYTWDITDIATEWYEGTTPQYGVVLRGIGSVGTFFFDSVNSGTPSQHPYIHVTFS